MILILGAMDEEVNEYLNHIKDMKEHPFFLGKYYTGNLFGKNVVLSKTGIGKTLSGITTQYFIDLFKVSHVIFTGIAGSMSDSVKISDTVIGTDLVFYDFDTTAFGEELGEVPRVGLRFIKSDERLVSLVKNNNYENVKYGLIGTGDKFISNKQQKENILKDFPSMVAIEMEGCSVALTCKIQNIPFIVLRGISDNASGDAPADFNDFLKQASKVNFNIVCDIVKSI